MNQTNPKKNSDNMFIAYYEQLQSQRNTLLALYGPRSNLKKKDPESYQHHQKTIRNLNQQLRQLRQMLRTMGLGFKND